jgi:LacI family transcriptional regulator
MPYVLLAGGQEACYKAAGKGAIYGTGYRGRDLEAMRNTHRNASVPHVGLFLETSTEYGRGLLRGIVRYSRLHGPWSLYVAPGHLEQELPSAKSWAGTGIIARIRSLEMAKLIRATRLPFVASSLTEFRSPKAGDHFGEIRTDSEAIARFGAEHLLERGFRRFAFCGFTDCGWSISREARFADFLRSKGFACFTHRIQSANWMHWHNWITVMENEQLVIAKWLQSLPRPVGVMACNDICGRALLQSCATAGLRVPDDVGVVGVDNDELMCELSNPPLSSIALNVEKAGYDSASLLDALMRGQSPGGRLVRVEPTHVVARRSSDVVAQEDPAVAAALQIIRSRATQRITVPDVVEKSGVSRRTLERRFSRGVGRSIFSEITRCHLEQAKLLLVETNLPLFKVAASAGFGSLKTFRRIFRQTERMTSSRFRRKARTDSSGGVVSRGWERVPAVKVKISPGSKQSATKTGQVSRGSLRRVCRQ